jgi:flagellar biosynthetic protein FlhB
MFGLTFELVWKSGLAYLVLGMADFYYQKWNYTEELKMTKQEVKEENKQQEGDLQAKMRIRQMGRDRIRKIMLKNVAKADVVITNPTHYAVALKYDPLQSDAPVVVAKGVDFLAQRIKDIARAHDVPIVEDKPLARLLYRIVDVDQTIPESVFTAVANVLAYVWKLKKKAPPRRAA